MASDDTGSDHFLFFAPSEKGHLHPLLPLLHELNTSYPNVVVTFIMNPWGEKALAECLQLLKPDRANLRVVNLYDLSPWRWDGPSHPQQNLPTVLNTADAVLAYCRALTPRPTAVFYDPFSPTAVVVARDLKVPLVCTVSFAPYAGRTVNKWYQEDDVTAIRERYAGTELNHSNWRHLSLPFVLNDALPVMFTTPSLAAASLPADVLAPVVFAGSSAGHPRPSLGGEEDAIVAAFQAAKERGQKVVYMSFGTVMPGAVEEDEEWRDWYFQLLNWTFDAVAQRPDIDLFVAIGAVRPRDSDAFSPFAYAHPRVHIYEWTPQLRILPYVDAYITHGGANSFNEALATATPLLVVPLWGDQPTNARVAEKLGFGVQFPHDAGVVEQALTTPDPPRQSLTAQTIGPAIDRVLQPELKSRVQALSDEYATHTAASAMPAIMQFIHRQK